MKENKLGSKTPHSKLVKFLLALMPFAVFGLLYKCMGFYPNYLVNDIDVQGLYEAEKLLFGINVSGERLTLCEYFARHHHWLADLAAGFFYLTWVPVPIAFGIYLYFTGKQGLSLRFASAFLFVNIVGFIGYYIHPAAPPWYVIEYGFEAVTGTPGNTAGLGRFDELIGLPVFAGMYGQNSNVFAAVPSLHAAYMPVAVIYAFKARMRPWFMGLLCFLCVGIWCTAVYSTHHYVIDVLLGIGCALIGVLLFEKGLMKVGGFARFMDKYTHLIGGKSEKQV